MIIYLGLLSPTASSDLPESKPGKLMAFFLVLLRMGFTCAPVVTNRAVVSYTAFPPLLPQAEAVYFCCTGLGVTSTGRYPASCPVKPGLSSSKKLHLPREEGKALFRQATRKSVSFFGRKNEVFSAAIISSTYCKSHYKAFYTLKQLPPQNSLIKELFGILSAGTLKK